MKGRMASSNYIKLQIENGSRDVHVYLGGVEKSELKKSVDVYSSLLTKSVCDALDIIYSNKRRGRESKKKLFTALNENDLLVPINQINSEENHNSKNYNLNNEFKKLLSEIIPHF
ncbi:hypothetical protein GQ473_01675 [archaeon]|nr:hypothetical protein [archaeon]